MWARRHPAEGAHTQLVQAEGPVAARLQHCSPPLMNCGALSPRGPCVGAPCRQGGALLPGCGTVRCCEGLWSTRFSVRMRRRYLLRGSSRKGTRGAAVLGWYLLPPSTVEPSSTS